MPATSKLPVKPRMRAPQRRTLIEQAAAQLFAERGYDATSVDEIAAAAGITKRMLYAHFPTKRDLYLSLLIWSIGELRSTLTEQLRGAGSLAAGLRNTADAFFGWVEERPEGWRLLFREPPNDPLIERTHREMQQQTTAAITAALAAVPALHTHAPPDHPEWLEMLAVQLKSAGRGLAAWWSEHPEVPRERLVEATVSMCWNGLAGLSAGAPVP